MHDNVIAPLLVTSRRTGKFEGTCGAWTRAYATEHAAILRRALASPTRRYVHELWNNGASLLGGVVRRNNPIQPSWAELGWGRRVVIAGGAMAREGLAGFFDGVFEGAAWP